ncbi:MAG: response regulator [Acidobacteria bacterium]|nr:response regulator [Acidobacteriota bacterium]
MDEFNSEVKKGLNSISALAVEQISIRTRLQKLVAIVCDVLQIPAAILLLTNNLPVSPKATIAGADEDLIQGLHQLNEQSSDKHLANLLPATANNETAEDFFLRCQALTDSEGRTYEFVILPLNAGTQMLGGIALASSACQELIREKSSLLNILAQHISLFLLAVKGAQVEAPLPVPARNEAWFTEEFLATLSHELRAPLHTILGWVSILQHPATSQEVLGQALKTIERSARTQSAIINDLLDASFCFNQHTPLSKRPVPIQSLLQQVMKTLLPIAEQKEVVLTTDIRLAHDYVMADAERLRQVFWHLLSNAIKFTAKRGHIQLSAQRVGDELEFRLVDSGIGITPEFLPHIFDPFRQENATTTRKFGGLGLGLAIARHQLELHGGSIEITSAGKHQGTTVIAWLPLARHLSAGSEISRDLKPSFQSQADIAKKQLRGVRVLVVDDDADSLEIVSTILQNCNSEVQTAANAQEALDVLHRWEPDVLISDIQMPGVDGYELMQWIRRDKPTLRRRIAAIAMTAYSRAEDRLKALASGFHTHLTKPVDPAELVAVVNSLVSRSNDTLYLT